MYFQCFFFYEIIYPQYKALCGKFKTKDCVDVKLLRVAVDGAVL